MIRLGLIGVEDNVELLNSTVSEYPEFDCLSFVHFSEDDVIELLESHSHEVDMWLFSGVYPYSIAQKWGKVHKPMFFLPYTGSSLYKTLYHVLYHHQINVDELSFDGLTPEDLNQVFTELDVPFEADYIPNYLYQKHHSLEDVVQHHYNLWSTGKTKAAATCGWQVHTELKRLGVPVFRVMHTKSAIKSVLNMALRTHEMLRFKDRQIAVQMFELDTLSDIPKDTYSSDEIYNIEIKHTQRLLKYAKKIQGSLKSAGPGRYVIFTTRGILSTMTQNFTVIPSIEEIKGISKGAITCGIGIGQSAYEAEIYAGNALLNAKEFGKGSWMVFFEDKMVNGPLGKPQNITYSYGSKEMQLISEQTSLSISTLSKINSIINKIGKTEFTAHELAQHMHIMPRSARRILTQLEKNRCAEEAGEETPYPRGRPRKLYRILL